MAENRSIGSERPPNDNACCTRRDGLSRTRKSCRGFGGSLRLADPLTFGREANARSRPQCGHQYRRRECRRTGLEESKRRRGGALAEMARESFRSKLRTFCVATSFEGHKKCISKTMRLIQSSMKPRSGGTCACVVKNLTQKATVLR